jgi:hypothetical protein
MEGFLEANRIVEVSLTKLTSIHKTGDLPLRKTLLISKVLNKAQEVATSAHLSLIRSPPSNSTRSSKLLASISRDNEQYTSDESRLLPRSVKLQSRQTSPIASANNVRHEPFQVSEEESMDFGSVSSVLSDIMSDGESYSTSSSSFVDLWKDKPQSTSKKSVKLLEDISNSNTSSSSFWSMPNSWQFEFNCELNNHWQQSAPSGENKESCSLKASSGKRNHHDAFPFNKENSIWGLSDVEESKRFKPSLPEGCPLESLPGFCGYLSPKNLQSAPLITYMFGNGFAQPSNPESYSGGDWPTSTRNSDSDFEINEPDHFYTQTPSHHTLPILAF